MRSPPLYEPGRPTATLGMMRLRSIGRLVAALLTVTAFAPSLPAQPESSPSSVRLLSTSVSLRRWGNEQGLPQASVTRLAIDRDGYVWGGTFGGLIRFDGQTVLSRSAREVPFLTGNAVTALLARADGELWIGTPTGTIGRLRDGRVLDTLPRAPLPPGKGALDLLMDADGTVWLSSLDAVYWYAEGRWSPAPLPYHVASQLAHDARGAVVFHGRQGVVRATRSGGQLLAPSVLPPATRTPAESPLAMHTDRRGRMWIGSSDGLHELLHGRLRRVAGVPGPVLALASDGDGALWIGSDAMLYRYRPALADTSLAAIEAVVNAGSQIAAIVSTADGALVVGTLDGLLVVRQALVTVIASPTGDRRIGANSMVGDGAGRLWVANACGASALVDRGGNVLDSIRMPEATDCTRSLARDARGRIWVGSDSAIVRRDANGGRRVWRIAPVTASPLAVRPLLVSGDTLWFGMSDGRIGHIGPDDALTFSAPWQLADDRPVESMARTDDGSVWVAQTGRLTRWVGARRTMFGAEVGIPAAVPRALLPRPGGGVWIGTYGSGLHYFRPGERGRPVPMPDQTVSALLQDDEGRLWMPGNRGLTVVTMASLQRWLLDSTEVPAARLLSSSAGVPEGNFGAPAATVIAPRVLGFASVGGLVVVESDRVAGTESSPRLSIDAIRTPRRTLAPGAGHVDLAADERVLQVDFSAPTFRSTEATEFRYRLDGRDAQWIPLGDRRDLRLVGLRPGRFVLHIEARVGEGAWRAADPLTLAVAPLFVERLWWRVALVLLMLGMAVQYVRQRLRAAEAEARVREVALEARQRAVAQQEQHQRELTQVSRVAVAGELTASLSHELGQPLAAIVNNAEVARRLLARSGSTGGAVDPRLDEALQDVVAQGHRASEVVHAFRRFLRREHGEREELGVRDVLESVTLLLGREYADAGVQLTLSVDPGVPALEGERVLLQQVFVNLLQNALQAAQWRPPGQVLVRARASAGGVRITVVDSGPGIAAEVRPALFEPFVTSRSGGLGMGLPIARRVVEAHGGHMGVGRLPGAGAVLSVWLPAARQRLTSRGMASSLH